MERKPSIHVSKDVLKKLLNDINIAITDEQLTALFRAALPHSLAHRLVFDSSKYDTKQLITASRTEEFYQFLRVYTQLYEQHTRRGITIYKHTASYTNLQRLCTLLSKDVKEILKQKDVLATYRDFFIVAFRYIKECSISKCVYRYDYIIELLSAKYLVGKQISLAKINNFYLIYQNQYVENTGSSLKNIDYADYKGMLNVLQAAEQADALQTTYRTYIVVLMKAYRRFETVPTFQQLGTDFAKELWLANFKKEGLHKITDQDKAYTQYLERTKEDRQ